LVFQSFPLFALGYTSLLFLGISGHTLAQLTQAKGDLEELGTHVGRVVDWWCCMNVDFQREMTRQNWETVGKRYTLYQMNVSIRCWLERVVMTSGNKISKAQDDCHHLDIVQQCVIKSRVNGNGSIFFEVDSISSDLIYEYPQMVESYKLPVFIAPRTARVHEEAGCCVIA
jgi:hypothetical protein